VQQAGLGLQPHHALQVRKSAWIIALLLAVAAYRVGLHCTALCVRRLRFSEPFGFLAGRRPCACAYVLPRSVVERALPLWPPHSHSDSSTTTTALHVRSTQRSQDAMCNMDEAYACTQCSRSMHHCQFLVFFATHVQELLIRARCVYSREYDTCASSCFE
jgi:hypothetical protein